MSPNKETSSSHDDSDEHTLTVSGNGGDHGVENNSALSTPPTEQPMGRGSFEATYSQYTLKRRPWRLNCTDFSAIMGKEYRGSGTQGDPFVVEWLEDDQENPKNFSNRMRWSITIISALMTFAVSMASSTYSGGIDAMILEFRCSEEVIILGLSLMVVGYAVGPLLWGPASEVYGRRHIFFISYFLYVVWTSVSCAAQNIRTLIVFRFLTGTFGSSALVIPGGQIADMFESRTRGLAVVVFCAAPFLGPAVGPLIGGYLSTAAGWRWTFGLQGIYAGTLLLVGWVFTPETYSPALLRQRAALLSKVTGLVYVSVIDVRKPLVVRELVNEALVRPWVLLCQEPIVLIITIYMSCIYGTLYMCFAAFPIVFQQERGWSPGKGGLGFMGILVGMNVGVLIALYDNRRYVRIADKTGGIVPPEVRLPPAIFGGGCLVVGLAWLAATVGPGIHWVVPILAGIPFAIGMVLVFVCLGNYLIDSYTVYAASVIAANSVVRSMVGAAFPLFTTYMYKNLGVNWATAVPGFIALVCFPFPILFYLYGAKLRLRCKYAARAAEMSEALRSKTKRDMPLSEGTNNNSKEMA